MTYFTAASLAIPITLFGIIVLFECRRWVKWLLERRSNRSFAAMADVGAAPVPDFQEEMRFTQSLLALSKVRSQAIGDFPTPEPVESSSLVLVHRAQSKIPDRAA